MKKIDLIIPCYNTHKTLYRLFGSIMSQNCKDDIHIILVDDCSDEGYDELIMPFKDILDIQIIRLDKNSGPGTARRVGMQAGKSPYIMFIDSDDTFFNAFSVERLLYEIESKQCDIVYSNFIEDLENFRFIMHNNDYIWVFAKIYRRQFLENFDIYFNDTRSNEDNGFNTLTRCFTEPQYVDETTYIWHHNPKSITRINNGLYTFTCTEGQVENKIWAFKNGYKRGWDKAKYLRAIAGQFCFYYFNYFTVKRQTREEIKTEDYLKWIKKFYQEFKSEIQEAISKDIFIDEYKQTFINYFNDFNNITILDLTIDDFINLLK
jgi:glycosyltransferase involved in cell wall biosynthesis